MEGWDIDAHSNGLILDVFEESDTALRDRLNPLEEYDDAKFRLRFRLRKDSVIKFTAILEHQTRRGLPLTPI